MATKAGSKAPGKAPAKSPSKQGSKAQARSGGKVVASSDPEYEYYEEEEEEEEEVHGPASRPHAPRRGSPRPPAVGVKPAPVQSQGPKPAPPPPSTDDIGGAMTGFSPRPPGPVGGRSREQAPAPPARPARETGASQGATGAGAAAGDRVPPELTKLFQLVPKFQPQTLELQPHFKPFLPDLQVAIGQIDAFIKVPRPDGESDQLGLKVLDEPTIGSANPQILKMQLREKFGVVGGNESDGYIGSIDVSSNMQKSLTNFLESYDEISRSRAAPAMVYSSKMPEIGELMEPWTAEMQEALDSCQFPGADLEMTLEEYARFVCSMLDIPVRGNIVESVHVLFTLLQRFKEISYFQPAPSKEI